MEKVLRKGLKPTAFSIYDRFENDDELLFKVELPKHSKGDFHLIFENGTILVCFDRLCGNEDDLPRAIELPLGVDVSRIEASFHAGILTLHLPKCQKFHSQMFEIPVD